VVFKLLKLISGFLIAIFLFLIFILIIILVSYQTGLLESGIKNFYKNQLSYRSIHTSWYQFCPVITINNLQLVPTQTNPKNNSQDALKIKQATLQINLVRSLWHFSLVTNQLNLSGLDVHFIPVLSSDFLDESEQEARWANSSTDKTWRLKDFIYWVSLQKNMSLTQANLYFPKVTYSNLNLTWTALSKNHQVYGHVLHCQFNSPASFSFNLVWTKHKAGVKISWLQVFNPYYRLLIHSDFNFNASLEGQNLENLFLLFGPLNLKISQGDFKLSGDLSSGVLENLNLNAVIQDLNFENSNIQKFIFKTQYFSKNNSPAQLVLSGVTLGPNALFLKPWPLMDISSQFDWNLEGLSQLKPVLNIQDLKNNIHTDHMDLNTQGEIQNIPVLKQDFLNSWKTIIFNLSGHLQGKNLEQVLPSYLPSHGISSKLKVWLLTNIIKAPEVSSQFKLQGVLKDFPFDQVLHNQASQFWIKTSVQEAEIIPWEHWPLIQAIQGSFTFHNQSFSADILQGQSLGLILKPSSISIPNILPKVPTDFLINLNIQTQDNLARDYLLKTPLINQIAVLNYLSFTGPYFIQASLTFPLEKPESVSNQYQEQITFLNNQLQVLDLNSPNSPNSSIIKNLSGLVSIHNQAVYKANLSGVFNNQTLTVDINKISQKTQASLQLGSSSHPAIKITGEGAWTGDNIYIKAHSEGENYEQFLNLLNIPSFLTQTQGVVDLYLIWNSEKNSQENSGLMPDVHTLSGSVKFDLKNGALKNVNPGVSRLLGLFSLEALSRRLSFNFKDMTEKGLAFNSLKGEYFISQGVAKTNNVSMQGPALNLLLKGLINIPSQTMDQTVLVSPELNSSIALVAGILGGPIIGIAAWVADHILSDTLFKNTGILYHLYGSWDHPEFKIIEDQKNNK